VKNFFIVILFFVIPVSLLGQSIFDKYHNDKEVKAVSISPKMFQLLGSMSLSSGDTESKALLEIIQGITSFRALITRSELISEEIDLWVKKEAVDRGLVPEVLVKESEIDLSVYVKEDGAEGKLKTLLMFSNGFSSAIPNAQPQVKDIKAVILLIEGNFEMDKIGKLISKMNLPGGDQLKMSGI